MSCSYEENFVVRCPDCWIVAYVSGSLCELVDLWVIKEKKCVLKWFFKAICICGTCRFSLVLSTKGAQDTIWQHMCCAFVCVYKVEEIKK